VEAVDAAGDASGAACGAVEAVEAAGEASGAACGAVKLDAEDLQHFQCPLTLEVMRNPVVTVDGHSFEESAIKLWLQKHDTSPMTNKVLESKILIPNISLKAAIEAAGVL
jgi:CBS domain-containing protein